MIEDPLRTLSALERAQFANAGTAAGRIKVAKSVHRSRMIARAAAHGRYNRGRWKERVEKIEKISSAIEDGLSVDPPPPSSPECVDPLAPCSDCNFVMKACRCDEATT